MFRALPPTYLMACSCAEPFVKTPEKVTGVGPLFVYNFVCLKMACRKFMITYSHCPTDQRRKIFPETRNPSILGYAKLGFIKSIIG